MLTGAQFHGSLSSHHRHWSPWARPRFRPEVGVQYVVMFTYLVMIFKLTFSTIDVLFSGGMARQEKMRI